MATNKIDIEEIFSLASEEEMLAFCKAYALSHTSFAEALQKRFAPKVQTVSMSLADFKKEIDRCYQHEMSKPRWYDSYNSYEPDFLDWFQVGKSLMRVIKKAQALVKTGNVDLAVEVALSILKENARYYDNDYLCEREDWDAEDMHVDECKEVLKDALDSGKLPKERMLKIADELEKLDRESLYSECYFDEGLDVLVDEIRNTLLTDAERLQVLVRNFNEEADSWRRRSLACNVWRTMLELGKEAQAIAFFEQNADIPELREEYVKLLLEQGKMEEALSVIDQGISIAKKAGHTGTEYSWIDRKLGVYEKMDDKEQVVKIASFLFEKNCDRMGKYRLLKKVVDSAKWDSFLDGLFAKCDLRYSAVSVFADIYKEEKKYQKLYDLVMNAQSNHLSALEKYAKCFTAEQQCELVKKVEQILCHIGFAPTRKGYQELADEFLRLSKTCPAGLVTAKKLIQQCIQKYPSRPALRDEMQKALRKMK